MYDIAFGAMWTGSKEAFKDLPVDFIEYMACTKMYHCLPSQLRKENLVQILRHMNYARAENAAASRKKR